MRCSVRLCECGCGQETPLAKKSHAPLGWVRGEPLRFVRGHNRFTGVRGHRSIDKGYVLVYEPEHSRAKSNGCVREHLLIVERALGHSLPPRAVVHHFDEDRSNNANNNLVACEDDRYHQLLHQRMRALAACGDPSAVRCHLCGGYNDQAAMRLAKRKDRQSVRGTHRACERAGYHRRKQVANG